MVSMERTVGYVLRSGVAKGVCSAHMTLSAQGSGSGGVGTIIGRDEESDAVGKFLRQVRDGSSGALVVLGEAGIGKTALLRASFSAFAGMRFVAVAGTESEQPLAYAGLQQLLSSFMEEIGNLPIPQQAALQIAFGIESGPAPDRFLVGIAALTLLAGAARERPLVAVIDDVQWWDAESLAVLGFVGRRIEVDSLGLLVTVRGDPAGEAPTALAGWQLLRLAGLDRAASTKLLADQHAKGMSAAVVGKLFEGTGGNPLALITVAAWLSGDQRSGRRPLPDPLPVGRHLEQLFSFEVRTLPAATRQLLLLASAAASGDSAVFWRACSLLALSAADVDAAVEVGIVRLETGVSFSHPLVRSAVYADASAAARREVHAALAASTDVEVDPDRRSWHLAAATVGPDEQVAAALERSSQRAADRGGHTSRAVFLRRAGELSVDAPLRTSRVLASAHAYYLAGLPEAAQALLQELPDQLPGGVRAGRDHLQMMLEIAGSRPRSVALIVLRNIADNPGQQPRQIRDALLEALHSVILTGRFGSPELAHTVAVAALSAVSDDSTPMTSADRLLKAFATRITSGFPSTVALLREAVDAGGEELPTSGITWFAMHTYAFTDLWDVRGEAESLRRMTVTLRAQGAVSGLIMTLLQLGGLAVRGGEFAAGEVHYAEAAGLLHALGSPGPDLHTTLPLAWQGQEAKLRQLAEMAEQIFGEPLGMGLVLGVMNYSLLILELSLGRYEQALVQANLLFDEDAPVTGSLCLPPMVEAAIRSGDQATARKALDRLSSRAAAVGNTFVRGLLSRSTALLSGDATAEGHYLSAIDDLGVDGMATELTWAHLLYGEWLRRHQRRSDARTELRIAYEAFLRMGARLWAERARRELIATGERMFTPTPPTGEPTLTPQEANIAALAVQGLTNQEIATQLFVGVSTVEYHLTKIFRKHQLTSRRQLRQLLPQPGSPASAPTPG